MYIKTKKLQINTLILSCDRYKDLWPGFFFQFQKYYPQRGKIYFGCNELIPANFYGREIIVVHAGKDLDWTSTFRNILNKIDSEYLLITLEDLYLNSAVNETVLDEVQNLIKSDLNVNHVKCTDTIKGDKQVGKYIFEIKNGVPYKVSLCGIWNRKYLLNLLQDGESPWDFEVNGSSRAKNDNGFYTINTPILNNINMVEKGLWIKSSLKWAIRNQIPISPNSRKSKTLLQELISIIRNLYFNLMMRAPLHIRLKIYFFVKKYLIIH